MTVGSRLASKNKLREEAACRRRSDDVVVGTDDLVGKRSTALRHDGDLKKRCVREKGGVVAELAAKAHRVAGIVRLKVDNPEPVSIGPNRKADTVEDAYQSRRIGGDRRALGNQADASDQNDDHEKEGAGHRSQGTCHLAGLGLRGQHWRFGLPDMRADRAADSLARLADLVAIDAKYRVAIRAGQKHAACSFSMSLIFDTPYRAVRKDRQPERHRHFDPADG